MSAPSTFVDPRAVVSQLGIMPESIVADFGCGAGYFSIECAKATGENGRVYALDVLPSALEAVESQSKTLGLNNITTKRANLEKESGSGLPPSSVDWVIAKDVLFQNEHKDILIGEVVRILKTGGNALFMEWGADDMGVGPEAKLRVSQEVLRGLIEQAGLVVDRTVPVGGFHYAFIAKKGQ